MHTHLRPTAHAAARRCSALALFVLVFASGVRTVDARAPVAPGAQLAMFVKPAVVRILDGFVGTVSMKDPQGVEKTYQVSCLTAGSGAFIDPDGYIVTNAHVTEFTRGGAEKGKELLFKQFVAQLAEERRADADAWLNDPETLDRIRRHSRLVELEPVHHVVLPNGDRLPFEIKAFGAPFDHGKDVAVIKVEIRNAPIVKFGDSGAIQLLDHVTVVGYPGVGDLNGIDVSDNKSALEASITDGKLSAKKTMGDGAPVLQISAPISFGNSGGPVFDDRGEVVGLSTFFVLDDQARTVSGFSFVVPSSTVLEFVRQTGAVNENGVADRRYREGLELYWQGRYAKAISKFEEVKRLFPQHGEVDRLIQESQGALSRGEGRMGTEWILLLALAGICALLFVAGALAVGLGAAVMLSGARASKTSAALAGRGLEGAAREAGLQPAPPLDPVLRTPSAAAAGRIGVEPLPAVGGRDVPAETVRLGAPSPA